MLINNSNAGDFPAQKIPESSKTDSWFERCAEAAINIARAIKAENNYYQNKLENYNLVNNIIDPDIISKALNPFGIKKHDIPVEYRNYPLINPVLNLLSGEERKRPYNFMVTVINQDALSMKMEEKNEAFRQFLYELIVSGETDESKIEQKLNNFARYMRDFRSSHEELGNQILEYLTTAYDLKEEFNRGFLDLLISGEEIYVIEIVNGEPILRKGNPLSFTFIKNDLSWKIEDSDIIVEEVYMSKGMIIDKYNEYLTNSQIDEIESGFANKYSKPIMISNSDVFGKDNTLLIYENADVLQNDQDILDSNGNIKVTRVMWSGFRKVGFISYFNEDMEIEKKLVPEGYVPDESLGETVKWVWIREWYEATKIGNFFVKKEPCQIQIRNMDNPSYSNPGIVGTSLNSLSNSMVKSLVDDSKTLQYLYNLYMAKLELAIKKFKGKIGKLPLHLIPDSWDVDKWMYYAEYLGWAVEDAYNESSKPAFQGKPAGMFQQGSPVIDLTVGNEIQLYINLLEFIERRFQDITGITPQRKGSISASETVGGVERSVLQSSNITERWFAIHENTRKRAMKVLLEATKIAWKNKSFIKEYVLDVGTRNVLKFEYSLFKQASYGVELIDSSREFAALEAMKAKTNVILQNGGPLSVVLDLYRINNLGELQRRIEEYETRTQQARQQEAEKEKSILQAQLEEKEKERQFIKEENDKDRELKLLEIRIKAEASLARSQLSVYDSTSDKDLDNNGVPDPVEIANVHTKNMEVHVKKYLEEKKLKSRERLELKKLKQKDRELDLKEKELKQERELKEKEMKTALKNKVSGEE